MERKNPLGPRLGQGWGRRAGRGLTGVNRGQGRGAPGAQAGGRGGGCIPETLLPTQPLRASFVLSLTTGLGKGPRREQTPRGKEGRRARWGSAWTRSCRSLHGLPTAASMLPQMKERPRSPGDRPRVSLREQWIRSGPWGWVADPSWSHQGAPAPRAAGGTATACAPDGQRDLGQLRTSV